MEEVLSSASHHAMLFVFIAKETIDQFGEAGEKAVTEGVKKYALQRGHRMALRTQYDGNPLNVENYLVYGEWEAFPGQMDLRFPIYAPKTKMENWRCPWYTEWEKRGLLSYGRYYCKDVDEYLAKGYGGLELKLLANRTLGDECCDFRFEGGVPEDRMEAFREKQKKIGKKAKMSWEYHVGHIYRTMRDAIVDAFGADGEAAIGRAMDSYEQEYGTKARELVLQYADIDYDAMPAYEGIGE